jgi:hypothetical protein
MTPEDLRALGLSIADVVTSLDAAEAATVAVQAERDAALATIDLLETEVSDLQAYKDAHPDAQPAPDPPPPPPAPVPEVLEFSDFSTQSAGIYTSTGLTGKGSGVTTYRMKAGSNTKPAGSLYALVRCAPSTRVALSGFTLEGTFQSSVPPLSTTAQPYGMEYSGLIVGGVGSTVTDVTVTGIPGHGSSPISTGGETASLSLLHAADAVLTNVHLDGRRDDGTKVAASLFEMNYTTGTTTWNGGTVSYALGGFAAALFQTAGSIVISDVAFVGNRKVINIEQALGGSIRFVRCDFRGSTATAYIAQVSSLGLSVSTAVSFEDCQFDNDQCVVNTYSTAANSGQNGQKDADIKRIDGGVVAPVGAKFKITHL